MSIHIHVNESCDSRQLDRIEQKLEEITNQLKSMKDQQAEHDLIVEELQQAIVAENEEIKKLVGELQPGKPIDLTKLKALKAAVAGMSDALVITPPEEGKHNLTIGFRSKGEETMSSYLQNNGADDEQASRIRGVFDAAKAAAEAQPAAGDTIDTTFSFSDNGQTESFTIDSAAKKFAADVVVSQAFLDIALTQLAEFQP